MMTAALIVAALWMAYANGANDNFKGVATLHGSGTMTYRQALALTTVATVVGGLASIGLAAELLQVFSGKGLVPDSLAGTPTLLWAVACAAGATVMVATRLAFPVSTTHALTGALLGAGFMAVGQDVNVAALGKTFLLPLLLSPLVALALTVGAQWLGASLARRTALQRDDCACIVAQPSDMVVNAGAGVVMSSVSVSATLGRGADCAPLTQASTAQKGWVAVAAAAPTQATRRRLLGVTVQQLLTTGHMASAAVLCAARGLNDTPKIAALMVGAQASGQRWAMVLVVVAMAVGGLLGSRRVAHTMSQKITTAMPDGPAFLANLVTATLVLLASRFGLPVSTTHVSVGAISGVGLAQGSLDTRVLRSILLSWVLTLPIAAVLGAVAFYLIQHTQPT